MSQITSKQMHFPNWCRTSLQHLLPIPQLLGILVRLVRLSLQSLHGDPLNVCAAYTHAFKILFFFNTYVCLVHSVQDYYILLKRNGSLMMQMLFTKLSIHYCVHSRRRINTNSMCLQQLQKSIKTISMSTITPYTRKYPSNSPYATKILITRFLTLFSWQKSRK